MLGIMLGKRRPARPDDGLDRSMIGYEAGMSEEEIYEAGRGCWVIGKAADSENYALIGGDGKGRLVVEIDRVVATTRGSRRAIEGRVLPAGHPLVDRYVGRPFPGPRSRNPISYITTEEPVDKRLCRCNCGTAVAVGFFVPGHDQRAIHERIARIGSVVEFLDWFDERVPRQTA